MCKTNINEIENKRKKNYLKISCFKKNFRNLSFLVTSKIEREMEKENTEKEEGRKKERKQEMINFENIFLNFLQFLHSSFIHI